MSWFNSIHYFVCTWIFTKHLFSFGMRGVAERNLLNILKRWYFIGSICAIKHNSMQQLCHKFYIYKTSTFLVLIYIFKKVITKHSMLAINSPSCVLCRSWVVVVYRSVTFKNVPNILTPSCITLLESSWALT